MYERAASPCSGNPNVSWQQRSCGAYTPPPSPPLCQSHPPLYTHSHTAYRLCWLSPPQGGTQSDTVSHPMLFTLTKAGDASWILPYRQQHYWLIVEMAHKQIYEIIVDGMDHLSSVCQSLRTRTVIADIIIDGHQPQTSDIFLQRFFIILWWFTMIYSNLHLITFWSGDSNIRLPNMCFNAYCNLWTGADNSIL